MKFKFIGQKWDTMKNSANDFQQALDMFVGGSDMATISVTEIIPKSKVQITVYRSYNDYRIQHGEQKLDIMDKFIIFGKRECIPFFTNITYNATFSDVEKEYNTKKLKLTVISQSATEFVVEIEKV